MDQAESQRFWGPIINDFQPLDSVWQTDSKRFYVDRAAGDPTNSALRLLKEGLLASLEQAQPYRAMLTGHRGSGKSFELARLAEELADHFFVVRFDADITLNPVTANHFDVILGIGLSLFAAARLAQLTPLRNWLTICSRVSRSSFVNTKAAKVSIWTWPSFSNRSRWELSKPARGLSAIQRPCSPAPSGRRSSN